MSNDNPIKEHVDEIKKKRRDCDWSADLIVPDIFWDDVTVKLIDAYIQKDSQRPQNLAIIGKPFSGKSTYIKYAIEAIRQSDDLDIFGIVRVSCLTNATLKGTYVDILKNGLGWPYSRQDSIQDLEMRLEDAVKKRACKLIVIDEFNQLEDRYGDARILEVLKALRNVPNRTQRPLVIVGTEPVDDLLKRDVETNSRFRKARFPVFEDTDKTDGPFQTTVCTLDQNLKDTRRVESQIGCNEKVIGDLFDATQGRMGALVEIYEEAAMLALSKDSKTLDESYISKAIEIFKNNENI